MGDVVFLSRSNLDGEDEWPLARGCPGRDWHRDYETWEALPVLDIECKVPRVERVIGYICLAPIVYGAIYVLVQLVLLAMARMG